MLVTRAQLKINQSILIHSGAGGVGIPTIQIAKAMGAIVFTTARKVHHRFLLDLGADHVIDYENENYIDAIQQLTGGKGVDVVIDTLGGNTLSDSGLILSQMGQVVTVVDIEKPQNLIHAWGKNATGVIGTHFADLRFSSFPDEPPFHHQFKFFDVFIECLKQSLLLL